MLYIEYIILKIKNEIIFQFIFEKDIKSKDIKNLITFARHFDIFHNTTFSS